MSHFYQPDDDPRFDAASETAVARSAPLTNPLLKFDAKPTRANAIRAKCAECVGCSREGTEPGFRATIRDCTSQRCPLWQFRPYQRAEADEPEADEPEADEPEELW